MSEGPADTRGPERSRSSDGVRGFEGVRNELSGQARDVVMAGWIGEVHFHGAAPPVGAPGQVVIGEIPREPPAFPARADLRDRLAGTRRAVVCALVGARGVGKTHLAAAYARRCIADGWPVVAWVGAETPDQVVSGLDRLATALGLREARDDSEAAAARAYWAAGHTDDAIALQEQVAATYERIYGPEHTRTVSSRHNLANAYRAAGRTGAAIALHEQVTADRRRLLGPDHPHTLKSRHSLAAAYLDAGRTGEAVELLERVVADGRRSLDSDHPDVLAWRNALASAYQAAGRIGEAGEVLEHLVEDAERVLRPGHPLLGTFRRNLDRARPRPGGQ